MERQEKQARNKIGREASAWVVRLADPALPPDQGRAFEAWRNRSPYHEVAYARALVAWDRLDRLQALAQGMAKVDADLLAPARARRLAPWIQPRPLRWAVALVGAAVILIGAAGVSALASPAYATGVGERRLIVLADGTQADLNTNSKIVVHFDRHRREVVVVRGEVLFKVAGERRPFIVRAADSRVSTRQAELDVRIRRTEADVVMRQGAAIVTIEPAIFANAAPPALQLTPDMDALAGPHGLSMQPIPSAEIDRVLAWRQGAIELSGQTLAQAVDEFNRYNRRQLVLADPSIAHLRLAGYFQCDDLPAFVTAVTSTFPVHAEEGDQGVIVLADRRGAG